MAIELMPSQQLPLNVDVDDVLLLLVLFGAGAWTALEPLGALCCAVHVVY